jgi:hypothetical protein
MECPDSENISIENISTYLDDDLIEPAADIALEIQV